MLSATTVKRTLIDRLHYVEVHIFDHQLEGSRVVLTIDCWISPSQYTFLGILASFIDKDWCLREALIGFEPLHSIYTGADLAKVIWNVISYYKIEKYVHAVTADNASNNKTLITGLNKFVKSAPGDTNFITDKIEKVSCLAYIVQLALKDLLGSIRIKPTNDQLKTIWNDQELKELEKGFQSIPFTLAKVGSMVIFIVIFRSTISNRIQIRKLAVFVNSSLQRIEDFERLVKSHCQSNEKPLRLIQDVSTRWDSTCYMLVRARALQLPINNYTTQYTSAKHFRLSKIEWKQVEYLIDITKPFNFFTQTIGKAKEPTIGFAFDVYTALFEHLHTMIFVLKKKKAAFPSRAWVVLLIDAINTALNKLDKYFQQTYNNLGSIYALGTILTPSHRLSTFDKNGSWLNDSEYWSTEYEDQFRRLYLQEYTAQSKQKPAAVLQVSYPLNSIALFMQHRKRKQQDNISGKGSDDYKVDVYLLSRQFIVIFIAIRRLS